MEPKLFCVLVQVEGYPESEAELAERVRRTLETHPTLSFRVEAVVAKEVPAGEREEFAAMMVEARSQMDTAGT